MSIGWAVHYVHCTLRRGTTRTAGYVPAWAAKLGARLVIKRTEWTDSPI